MSVIILSFIGVVLLFLLALDKKQIKRLFEFVSVIWFRLAFAFLGLFVLNIIGGFIGIYFPINIVSGLILAFLGLPGLVALGTIAIVL